MENKLQQLTEKLYQEGLSKGRQEADELLASAQAEAAATIEKARKEAADIVAQAQRKADDVKKNMQTEMTLSSRAAIDTLKQQIANLVIFKAVSPCVSSSTSDAGFIGELLVAVAKNWNGSTCDLKAILPADKQGELDAFLKNSLSDMLSAGLEVTFDGAVKTGFKIGPRDGSYYISFTDADFDAFLKEYLRPKVSELLYCEK